MSALRVRSYRQKQGPRTQSPYSPNTLSPFFSVQVECILESRCTCSLTGAGCLCSTQTFQIEGWCKKKKEIAMLSSLLVVVWFCLPRFVSHRCFILAQVHKQVKQGKQLCVLKKRKLVKHQSIQLHMSTVGSSLPLLFYGERYVGDQISLSSPS